MQRPQPAQPVYRYSKVFLPTLVASFAAAWFLVVIAIGLPGVVPFAGKLAISLFLGILATILWLDFWGYTTLRGMIDWRTTRRWMMRVGVIGLLIVFPIVVGVYLARTVLDSLRARTTGTKRATPPTRFRTTSIGLATLLGVTLLVLVVSTVGVGAVTGVASAQGSSTNGGHNNVRSPGQPIATSTRNQGHGKGKKGRGHHPHQG